MEEEVSKWQLLKKVGAKKKIKNPTELLHYAYDYFESIDNNPYYKEDVIRGGDAAGMTVRIKLDRPYTWEGLNNFLRSKGIIKSLNEYRLNRKGAYDEYVDTITAISDYMYQNKFEGATIGIFKTAIIARDLGLVEQSRVEYSGEQPLFGDDDEQQNETD